MTGATSLLVKKLFTPDTVRQMLARAQLVGNKPLPKQGDHVYESLAAVLNQLSRVWMLPEREAPLQKIGEAIETLATLLPIGRVDSEAELRIAEYTDIPEYVERARSALKAYDALLAAIAEAKERDIPIAPIEILAPKITGETTLIRRLEQILSRMLPECGVAQRHRSIALAVQQITGRILSADQVRDRIRKSICQ